METPSHLLVPTDFSVDATHAAERAALIARQAAASMDLIHVASMSSLDALRRLVGEIPPDVGQRILDKEQSDLREIAKSIQEQHGLACDIHLACGMLVQELLGHATTLKSDLFVLGARGTSRLRHFLLGSTAERLVSRAPIPCLVVKKAPRAPYDRVLVAVDLSPASLRTLRCAHAVAPDAEFLVLHAFEVPFEGKLKFAGVEDEAILRFQHAARDEAMQRLRQLCDEAALPMEQVSLRTIHGDPSHHIIEQEHAYSSDLIVVARYEKDILEQLLLGSVTRHVLAESRCDVLIAV